MTGALDHVQSSVIMQTSPPDKTFQQLLFTGIFCWVLTIFLLLVVAWFLPGRESFSSALMWGLGHSWLAYGMGIVALLLRSALMRRSPLSALAAYLLPAVAVSAASALCLAVYPDQSFLEEMAAYSPALLVFYVFGFAWMRLRSATGHEFARAVLPPFIGGLILLAFIAVPVFTGNAFRYRDAFVLDVKSKTQRDGFTEVDAVLELVDVDEQLGSGDAQLHHRQQAVPAGEDARILAVLLQQRERVVKRRCSYVVDRCWCLHLSPLLCRADIPRVERWCGGPPD